MNESLLKPNWLPAFTLVDIGANLADPCFKQDLPEVLQNAFINQVESIIITGSDYNSIQQALDISRLVQEKIPKRYLTVGLHPHHADQFNEAFIELMEQSFTAPEVVAIGECGLDYYRLLCPREIQIQTFEAHLEYAAQTQLPVFIHERDAHEDMIYLLRKWRARLDHVVIHCFTNTLEVLNQYLSLDCYIGITGWVTDSRRNQALQKAILQIPFDRLLIETDAPYLLPRNLPTKPANNRNEPALLPWVAKAIAEMKHIDLSELLPQLSKNSARFFHRSELKD